ncbi:ATP-binding protein [uncultured Shewanella sp.]|uniref:sensor histidine kinase n=1 Tax=uncultured Shewanella sp. TaxID=173975 RepID=UPI002631D6A7|nr:ATP-binding protein [uncultured Shewanella sp.]
MAITIKTKNYLYISIFLLAGLAVTLKATHWFYLNEGYTQTAQQSKQQMTELVNFLDGSLSRYESIPHLLSTNPLLKNALINRQKPDSIQALNLYLEQIQHITESLDIYLIDTAGVAISASNWQEHYSFIGKDFSYRPYFQEAISGKLGRYYAVGASSDKRGFYFSYPIYHESDILGVIVVKVDITDIERQSSGIVGARGFEFAITDPDDIIFLSSIDNWLLHSLSPIEPSRQHEIDASKRYANRTIDLLSIEPTFDRRVTSEQNNYAIESGSGPIEYIESRKPMARAGWTVHIMAPLSPIYHSLPAFMIFNSCIYLLLALAGLFGYEKRKSTLRIQQANDQLEQRVQARTQALEASNQKLNETQDELIQAAKLTVIGSLSASINHEINQPLAAIRSYAQNTQTLVKRNQLEHVSGNIDTIISLTDRLAAIVGQFKSFTRKSQGDDRATDISQCISDSLTIIQPEIDKQGIELILSPCKVVCEVWGDNVRLQQVLVNLMSNAIVAMRHCIYKKLTVTVSKDTMIHVLIQDSGSGVQESQMEKIFEPYFTTNERQGLGLGLSISRRIIESMQGKITVSNACLGGAIFKISLPIHHQGKISEDLCHQQGELYDEPQ